ncbi:hypothetical protein Scep_021521 [Stephania cephalantha]|uniref:Uncharacterized protein n=1 Tax=Stephania cephalantha TaxID=152367 RepID=A0AAP0F6A3_9MAGN
MVTSNITIHRQVEVLLSERYKLHDNTICWCTCMVIHTPQHSPLDDTCLEIVHR